MTYTPEYMLETPEAHGLMDVDVLSDALDMVRLSGALVFRVDIRGPWGIAGDPALNKFASVLPAGSNHIIVLHIVISGECWVRHASCGWFRMPRGHAVVLAHGDRHDLADRRGRPTIPFTKMLDGRPVVKLRHERFETGTGETTGILCGILGCDRSSFEPLCSSLPALFTVALDERANQLTRYAANEAVEACPGADSLRVRMAELLFMETLRLYMQDLPSDATGLLAGLRDPLIVHALRALHKAPQKPWSVESLAACTHTSRSSLAERFREVIGEPPMHYLTRLRMHRAGRYLNERTWPVDQVADEVGYESSAAFQRAFKRHFGVPPAAWRRAARR
ncbi:MAG: AraC family transcriptional regulator [Gammaproteobacteria bacterium]|nr:AraC family transcriptional regulator [Gammaproteobacteria bacterium]